MNELEEKAQYFAQHWGQKVFKFRGASMSPQKVGATYMSAYGVRNRYLLLTILSKITDEDALMCYNLHFKGYLDKDLRPDESRVNFSKKHIVRPIEVCIPIVIDYLRSKGYALPFRQYSVEQLIEKGWLKLKGGDNG